MMEYCHLKKYDLKLTAKSPLFIGSGREYNKKDYYYDRQNRKVHIINVPVLFSILITRGLVDEYENYILNRPKDDLYRFFSDCGFTGKDIASVTEYTADVSDALVEDKPLTGIQQFMRDTRQRPYVPGSSVKGCLRTALLWKMINSEKKNLDYCRKTKDIEAAYLNTVQLNKRKAMDEVNSILRGVSISDSMPIDDRSMILTKKEDISTLGNRNTINIIREAAACGTVMHLVLTLDESVSSLKVEDLKAAVSEYGEYYKKTFVSTFHLPDGSEQESFQDCIILGGGSGFFGKNIVYPLYGRKKAVADVSGMLQRKFPMHHHEKDIALTISPHMIKYTRQHSKSYHYGVCRVEIS